MSADVEFISIFKSISFKEYKKAAMPGYSYFPIIEKTGEKDEDGKPIEIITYAQHKYIYDKEMKDFLETGHVRGEL